MSIEVQKDPGITAPVTPREPQGRLPGFLRRLFVPQPPPELENFTTKIHQGIDNHLATQRQQELERKNAEAAERRAEAALRVEVAQEQRAFEQKKAEAVTEAKKILGEFQIEERLKYIQRTVWKGKGNVRFIEPGVICRIDGTCGLDDRLGGFELIHQYPLFILNQRTVEHYEGGFDEWRYEPKMSGTSLSIVLKEEGGKKVLNILSKGEIGKRKEGTYVHDPHYYTYDFSCKEDGLSNPYDRFPGSDLLHVSIPIATQESAALLDSALALEANFRITNNFLPSQLEDRARTVLRGVKQRPCWMKWTGMRIGW